MLTSIPRYHAKMPWDRSIIDEYYDLSVQNYRHRRRSTMLIILISTQFFIYLTFCFGYFQRNKQKSSAEF